MMKAQYSLYLDIELVENARLKWALDEKNYKFNALVDRLLKIYLEENRHE